MVLLYIAFIIQWPALKVGSNMYCSLRITLPKLRKGTELTLEHIKKCDALAVATLIFNIFFGN